MMFNDAFCLTHAVLDGTKTMTRRTVRRSLLDEYDSWYEDFLYKPVGEEKYMSVEEYVSKRTAYKVGEVVAIAQSYKEIYPNADFEMIDGNFMTESVGWSNKMFVRANLMKHHIRITDVRVERLQDISKEDCLKEGIIFIESLSIMGEDAYFFTVKHKVRQMYDNILKFFSSPQRAYADLIDKISGRGTWESNPLVVAYSFELVD